MNDRLSVRRACVALLLCASMLASTTHAQNIDDADEVSDALVRAQIWTRYWHNNSSNGVHWLRFSLDLVFGGVGIAAYAGFSGTRSDSFGAAIPFFGVLGASILSEAGAEIANIVLRDERLSFALPQDPISLARWEGRFEGAAESSRRLRWVEAGAYWVTCAVGISLTTIGAVGGGADGDEPFANTDLGLGVVAAGSGCSQAMYLSLSRSRMERDWEDYQHGYAPASHAEEVNVSVAPSVTSTSVGLALTGTF